MNVSQAFILDIRQTASANLSIASSAVLTVASWYVHENIADTAAPTAVVLNDFVSNSIFLADSAITAYDISDDGVLSVSYTQGTQVKRQNFSFLDKNGDIIAMKLVDGVGGKYLSTAIPEPAERGLFKLLFFCALRLFFLKKKLVRLKFIYILFENWRQSGARLIGGSGF